MDSLVPNGSKIINNKQQNTPKKENENPQNDKKKIEDP
jgi:hypothetical protein